MAKTKRVHASALLCPFRLQSMLLFLVLQILMITHAQSLFQQNFKYM